MTIKTNAEGKVVLQVSADVEVKDGTIVHLNTDMPIDEEGNRSPVEGVVYVDRIPTVPVGYDLYFDGTAFTTKPNPNHEQAKLRAELQAELDGIDRWFSENDWKHNKTNPLLPDGDRWEKDNPKWIAYCEERQIKRARRDFIVAMLGGA